MVDERPNLRGAVERLRDASTTAYSAATDTPLRQLLEAVANEVRQVAAEVERLYAAGFVETNLFFGLYRGSVVSSADPADRGRLQVIVPEVSDQVLGWATPSLPLGGSTGESPAPGSVVWVMFERGDPSSPVAIGSCPV